MMDDRMIKGILYVAFASAALSEGLSAIVAQEAYDAIDPNTEFPQSVEDAYMFLFNALEPFVT